jgi:hypothetical protein
LIDGERDRSLLSLRSSSDIAKRWSSSVIGGTPELGAACGKTKTRAARCRRAQFHQSHFAK